jgi:hypothetical protein
MMSSRQLGRFYAAAVAKGGSQQQQRRRASFYCGNVVMATGSSSDNNNNNLHYSWLAATATSPSTCSGVTTSITPTSILLGLARPGWNYYYDSRGISSTSTSLPASTIKSTTTTATTTDSDISATIDEQPEQQQPPSQQQPSFQFTATYVHRVSKTVLEHLQDSRSDWLQDQGLHRGLRINANGTFVLHFPAKRGYDAGRIWYVLLFLHSYDERACV